MINDEGKRTIDAMLSDVELSKRILELCQQFTLTHKEKSVLIKVSIMVLKRVPSHAKDGDIPF